MLLGWMGGDFPPDWVHSADGLAVKAGNPEQSIFSGVDPELTSEALKRLNWEGKGAFDQRLEVAPDRLPSTYIVACEDPSLPPAVQRQWASRATNSLELPSGHSPHLSHTKQVARAIADAVARAASSN